MGCAFCWQCEYSGNLESCPICGSPTDWDEREDDQNGNEEKTEEKETS